MDLIFVTEKKNLHALPAKKLTKMIGFIGHAIMSIFLLCALNILIF